MHGIDGFKSLFSLSICEKFLKLWSTLSKLFNNCARRLSFIWQGRKKWHSSSIILWHLNTDTLHVYLTLFVYLGLIFTDSNIAIILFIWKPIYITLVFLRKYLSTLVRINFMICLFFTFFDVPLNDVQLYVCSSFVTKNYNHGHTI